MANKDPIEQPEVAATEPEAPPLPDYLTNPDAVSADEGAQWRFGKAPNYANTRRVWAQEKKANHAAGSLPELVENLVKNWEVEASFKTRLSDWRTIDHANYTFAMNGEAPQTAEHMLKCGTYNAIIQSNEYYCPLHSDFASSHKTFKRMMPTFAWEVLEVYSGPPKVVFKWRHWGVMKNDYVGFNDKGEKVTAKAHSGLIEIFGTTVASVDDKVRLQHVDTYMDPLQMFRQIAPNGIVNKQPMNHKVELTDALDAEAGQNGAATAIKIRKVRLADNLTAESEHERPEVSSDIQQTTSKVTKDPASLVNTCPFATTQNLNVESSTQQPDAASNGVAGIDVGNPVEMVDIQQQKAFCESNEFSSTAAHVQQPVSNPHNQEPESRHIGMDLNSQAPMGVDEHDSPNAQGRLSHEVENDDSGMNSNAQAPTTAAGHTTSYAQAAEPVSKDHPAAVQNDVANGPDIRMDIDSEPSCASASAILEAHIIANLKETQSLLEQRHKTAMEAITVSSEPEAVPVPTPNAQDIATSTHVADAVDKQPDEDLPIPPMSDTHSLQDVHPHVKDGEEHVQADAGEAVAVSSSMEETQQTRDEMSNVTAQEEEKMNIE